MNDPHAYHAYHGTPGLARHPAPTAPAPTVSAREWPTLTLYRDGLANLNGLATRLLARVDSIMLLPPTAARARWTLLRALPELEGLADKVRLVGRADRDHLRFRAPALALALFAALPEAQKAIRLQLEASPSSGWVLVAQ